MKTSRFLLVLALFVWALLLTEGGGYAQQPEAAQKGKEQSAPTLDQLFKMLDRNGDGNIAKDEAVGPYAPRFAIWDKNGDGFASREEVRAYRASIGFDDAGVFIGKAGPKAGQPKAGVGRRASPATAQILKEPADWQFEAFPVPPPFAPDVKLTGSEEARFSPGMYDNSAPDYFTYIMAFALDGTQPIAAAELKDFAEKYFGGLSEVVGRQKGMKIDRSQIVATVMPRTGGTQTEQRFDADLVFFDSFTDGRKITLHLDAQVIPRTGTKKNYLILLVSPAAKDSATWEKLREVGKKTAAAIPE
jgi:hypothetical protein